MRAARNTGPRRWGRVAGSACGTAAVDPGFVGAHAGCLLGLPDFISRNALAIASAFCKVGEFSPSLIRCNVLRFSPQSVASLERFTPVREARRASVVSIPSWYATDLSHVKRNRATDMPALSVPNLGVTHDASSALAENLKRIVEQAGISTRAWALSKKLEPRNIHRIIAGTQSPTLDLLSEIGAAVGMDPWQLLVPGLDPANPPVVTMTKAERDFYRKVREEFRTLPSL